MTYVGIRVKGGVLSHDGFTLETAHRQETIPWDRIELFCLGIVQETIETGSPPPSVLRRSIRELTATVSGDQGADVPESPRVRQSTYVDFFVKGCEVPYRIDSGSINYRGLLKEVGYVSERNFRMLLGQIMEYATFSRLDDNFKAFLSRTRAGVKSFPNVYAFQQYCLDVWNALKRESSTPSPETREEGDVADHG